MPFFAAAIALLLATPAPTPAPRNSESPRGEQQALYDSALADYQAGHCDTAMPSLNTLVATGFHARESALALRECYLLRYKDADGAVAALEAEIKANPADEVAHSNLGCFYLLQKKKEESKSELISALKLNPNDIDARLNLAFWYAAVGQAHTAIAEDENILKTDPDNKDALTELCTLISEQENDAKRAEPYCSRAAVGQESNELVGVSLGLVRMRTGNLDGAEAAFDAVLAAHPEAHTARTFFGVSRLQRGDYDGAARAFQAVLAKAPDDVDARVNLARVYQARKQFGLAATEYRTAWHQSGNELLLAALVKVYLQQYYYGVVFALLAAMGLLLWRYLNVKTPEPPQPAAAH